MERDLQTLGTTPLPMVGGQPHAVRLIMKVMEKNKKDIWFPSKKYGVGWGFPITWQGWLVLLFYVLLVLLGVRVIVSIKPSFGFVFLPIYIVLLSVVLILICKKKGENLDFRWGDKKKSPKL